MIFLLVMAAVVVAAPLVAAVLVAVASHREDSARSLRGRPPGVIAAAARKLLCLHTSGLGGPQRSAGLTPADQAYLSRAYSEFHQPRSAAPDQTLTVPRS